jgi:hypothetical protein
MDAVPPRLAYVGAAYFRDSTARPLAVGSQEESLFIDLIWASIGADTVFDHPFRKPQPGPQAANVARILERQRAGIPLLGRRKPAMPTN